MEEQLISFVEGAVFGAALLWIYLIKSERIQRKQKVKWSCPIEGCDFKVSSPESHDVVLRAADIHTSYHEEK